MSWMHTVSAHMIGLELSGLRSRGAPGVGCLYSFKRTTFAEIRAAAKQTQLPIASSLQEVIEADLASPPLPGEKTRPTHDACRKLCD